MIGEQATTDEREQGLPNFAETAERSADDDVEGTMPEQDGRKRRVSRRKRGRRGSAGKGRNRKGARQRPGTTRSGSRRKGTRKRRSAG